MEISLNKSLSIASFIFALIGVFFCFLAILYHPFMGDDFLNQHSILQGTFLEYIIHSYTSWSGRLFSFIVPGLFFLNSYLLILSKILVIPCFLIMSSSAFYLASAKLPWRSSEALLDFIIFTSILWLGLPVVGITIVWLSGSVYLWMSTITLLFLSFIYRFKLDATTGHYKPPSLFWTIFLSILAFFVGVTGLQFFLATLLILTYWSFQLFREHGSVSLNPKICIILLSFLIGIFVFFFAPGNYVRLEHSDSLTLLSNLRAFVLFVSGAYFGVGVGDLGRALWIGVLLILALNALTSCKNKIMESFFWFVVSLATLLPFLPLIHFAAPRITFITVIFFLIGIQSLCSEDIGNRSNNFKKQFAASILLLLVAFDGFVGFAANRSLNTEVDNRMNIIQQQIALGSRDIVVPNYATIPSRLTYMQTPQHDQKYLKFMAQNLGIDSITLNDEPDSPKPYSLQPLKALKN